MEADSVPYRASARGSRQARAAYDTLRCTFWWSSGVAWSTPTPHHPGAGSLTPAGSTVACACFMLLSCSPYADCTGASRCGARGYAPLHWSRNQVSNIPEIILGASPRGPKRSIGVPGCAHGSLFRWAKRPPFSPPSCRASPHCGRKAFTREPSRSRLEHSPRQRAASEGVVPSEIGWHARARATGRAAKRRSSSHQAIWRQSLART